MAENIDLEAEGADNLSAPETAQSQPQFQDVPAPSSSGRGRLKKYAPYLLAGGIVFILAMITLARKGQTTATDTTGDGVSATQASGSGADSADGGQSSSIFDPTGLIDLFNTTNAKNQQTLSDLQKQLNDEQQAAKSAQDSYAKQIADLQGQNTTLLKDINSIEQELKKQNSSPTPAPSHPTSPVHTAPVPTHPSAPPHSTTTTHTGKVIVNGVSVKTVQTDLQKLGYYKGPIDGIIGSGTSQAIYNFQKAQHLTTDYVVGNQTWSALQKATAAKSSPFKGGTGKTVSKNSVTNNKNHVSASAK